VRARPLPCMGEPVQVADTSFLYALFSKSAPSTERPVERPLPPMHSGAERNLSRKRYRSFTIAWGHRGEIRRELDTRSETNGGRRAVSFRVEWMLGNLSAARGRLSYPDAVVLAWWPGTPRYAARIRFQAILCRAKR